MSKRSYFVYILTNASRTLYVGVTNDLERRIAEHRSASIEGFSKRYHLTKLVFVEECGEIEDVLAREKQIKGWRRSRKLDLIARLNPAWADLADPAERDPSLRSG